MLRLLALLLFAALSAFSKRSVFQELAATSRQVTRELERDQHRRDYGEMRHPQDRAIGDQW